MSTRNIVPRANGEGNIGTTNKKWGGINANTVTVNNVEANTVTVNNVDVFFMLLKRNKTYKVGDIAYSPNLPSWTRLECVVAGTTGDSEPNFSSIENGGVMTNDGTCTFIIDDVRDMTRVGAVMASLYIPPGYVLADGSTKSRADYPRLVNLIEKYNLWTDDTTNDLGKYGKGDNNTTFLLPNLVNRHVKYASSAGVKLEAGLPDIKGQLQTVCPNSAFIGTSGGSGAFTSINTALNIGRFTLSDITGTTGINFNASAYNSIYGKAETVQPPSIQYLPIIRY